MVNFAATPEVLEKASFIAKAVHKYDRRRDTTTTIMDLIACHNHGCPINFTKMEAWLKNHGVDFNILHDICGINLNLNRKTGKLENCFLPRFAA